MNGIVCVKPLEESHTVDIGFLCMGPVFVEDQQSWDIHFRVKHNGKFEGHHQCEEIKDTLREDASRICAKLRPSSWKYECRRV
jgi:hypothetical protein